MNRIKELRKQAGLTQEKLAKMLSVTQANLSGWELDKWQPDQEALNKLADYFNVSVDYILGRDVTANVQQGRGVKIPVYGEIAAGIPIEAIEDIIDFEEITPELAASGEFLALSIKGDSMAPRIQNGDVVIIRRQETVENGDIAAVMVNGDSATLKRVKLDNNGIWLLPLNPAFDPIFYTKKECADKPVRILGKMIELRAKF
ncbi:MAG: helix-turn-helix domain-containing protein [Clostridia bacterium]|nr:helix-turn-helix domain-containing protein [Clostridia bacterium]